MITKTFSSGLNGSEGILITIETEIVPGIGIHLVGVRDALIKEILLRTVTALQSAGYYVPGRKIIINIAPANLRDNVSGLDLPVGLSIISASGQDENELKAISDYIIIGELGLDSSIRPVAGEVQAVELAIKQGKKGVIISDVNALPIAELFQDRIPIYGVKNLMEAIDVISGKNDLTAWERFLEEPYDTEEEQRNKYLFPAFDAIKYHESEKRAIEIAAAGGFNMLLVGAPGTMKHQVAKAMNELLPPMEWEEMLSCAKNMSANSRDLSSLPNALFKRPFRNPHYSLSMSALIGGGSGYSLAPGEVTMASDGTLYIDEINMMSKGALDCLRVPLEDKKVIICRLKSKTEYPAKFQLVGGIDPCPCGYYGEGDKCTCTPNQLTRFHESIVQMPVYDYFGIQVWCHKPVVPTDPTTKEKLDSAQEPISDIQKRVIKARKAQRKRYAGSDINCNAELATKDIDKYCHLDDECKELLEKLNQRMGLSIRSTRHILAIARTIADLEGSEQIKLQHVAEASSYRFLDRIKF